MTKREPAKPVELSVEQRERLESFDRGMAFGGTRPKFGSTPSVGEQRLIDLGLAKVEGSRIKITELGRATLRAAKN